MFLVVSFIVSSFLSWVRGPMGAPEPNPGKGLAGNLRALCDDADIVWGVVAFAEVCLVEVGTVVRVAPIAEIRLDTLPDKASNRVILSEKEPCGIRTTNGCVEERRGHDLEAELRAIDVDSVVSRVGDKRRVRKFARLLEELRRYEEDCWLITEQYACLVYLLAKGHDGAIERIRSEAGTSKEIGVSLAVKECVSSRDERCAICRKRRGERAAEDTESIIVLGNTSLRSHISDNAGPYAVHIVVEHVLGKFNTLRPVEDVHEHLVRYLGSVERNRLDFTSLGVESDALEDFVNLGSVGRILWLEEVARGCRCDAWLSSCVVLELLEEHEVEFGAHYGRILLFSKDIITLFNSVRTCVLSYDI